MKVAVIIVAVVVGLPGAGTALHLGLLAGAWLFSEGAAAGQVPPVRFFVLIPAYNEEKVIGETLTALFNDRRPNDRFS